MNRLSTIIVLLCMLLKSACSLLPDPDPYPSGDRDAAIELDERVFAEDIFIPPVTGQNPLDAGMDQGLIPDMQAPLEPDASAEQMAVPRCDERCSATDDCLPDHECRNEHCVRVDAFDLCQEQDFCIAAQSRWLSQCMSHADCGDATLACIRVGQNQGRCARRASDVDCASEGLVDLPRIAFADDSERVSVCTQVRAICRDENCVLKCVADTDCSETQPQHPICDIESGRCVCTPESCTRNASFCGTDGQCECVADSDCTEGADQCFAGQCGCSSTEICADAVHPGTAVVCEP